MHFRRLLLLAMLFASPALAQEPAGTLERWIRPGEAIPAVLGDTIVYRLTVHAPGVQVRVTHDSAPGEPVQAPMVAHDSRRTEFEIYPRRTGPHTFVPSRIYADSVLFRLTPDSALTRQGRAAAAAPRFTFGVEAAYGIHGGYQMLGPTGPDGSAGTFDLCLSVRVGHGVGACFGYSSEGVPDSSVSVPFAFAEVRIPVLGSPVAAMPVTAGLAFRLGVGGRSGGDQFEPFLLGAGAWVAWWPSAQANGRGLSLRASGMIAGYGPLTKVELVEVPSPLPGEDPTLRPVSSSKFEAGYRFLLGVNWHP